MRHVELLIIGAGPAGVAVAGEARAAGLAARDVAIVDRAAHHSASIRALYPAHKPVTANTKGAAACCESACRVTDCTKDELLAYLDGVLARSGVRPRYGVHVDGAGVVRSGDPITVRTSGGSYAARAVVVAVGVFGRPRRPDYRVPGSLRDRVHYDVTSASIAGEDVLVVGGGDSAAEYCQYLMRAGNRVTLSYRRAELTRMQPAHRAAVRDAELAGRLDVWRGSSIERVTDDAGRPAVRCARGAVTSQRFDRIVYALGGTTPIGFLRALGVRSHRGIETDVPGVYLAGDLAAGDRGGSINAAFRSARRVVCTLSRTPRGPGGPLAAPCRSGRLRRASTEVSRER